MHDRDTLPWYRQFWPWFLILLPGSVVVAAIATLIIAQRGADDLVVDEYYKEGLAINRRLAKLERAAALGLSAELHVAGDGVEVLLSGPADHSELHLALSHPLEADNDLEIVLRRGATGAYAARLPRPVSPHWHWHLEPPAPARWRLAGVLDATEFNGERRD